MGEASPLYTLDILRLAASIPGQREFAAIDPDSERRSPTCGSRMRVAVTLDEAGRVATLEQAVEACAFGQAAAHLMAAGAAGRSADEVAAAIAAITPWLADQTIVGEPWPGLALLGPARTRPGRHGAILLPFRALLAAIDRAARASPPSGQ